MSLNRLFVIYLMRNQDAETQPPRTHGVAESAAADLFHYHPHCGPLIIPRIENTARRCIFCHIRFNVFLLPRHALHTSVDSLKASVLLLPDELDVRPRTPRPTGPGTLGTGQGF